MLIIRDRKRMRYIMEYKRWNVSEKDLKNLTPEKARELIEECIFQAQKETVQCVAMAMGKGKSEDAMKKQTGEMIRNAFNETGGSYDNPYYDSLNAVVQFLAKNVVSWGTPPEIANHHKEQLEIVLNKLKENKQ